MGIDVTTGRGYGITVGPGNNERLTHLLSKSGPRNKWDTIEDIWEALDIAYKYLDARGIDASTEGDMMGGEDQVVFLIAGTRTENERYEGHVTAHADLTAPGNVENLEHLTTALLLAGIPHSTPGWITWTSVT